MKKYRCPKCKTEFQGKLEHCPNCGTELHYIDEEIKKTAAAPKAEFHFDDFDIDSKGLDEEPEFEEEEAKPKSIYNDKPELDAKVDAFGNYLSYFDGNSFQRFLWRTLGFLITICTAFIGLPWAMCLTYRWETKHTVIDGRRLEFDGKGIELFGRYLLWLLLTILTVFIFLVFLLVNIKKWKMMHTHFKSVKIKEVRY